MKNFDPKKYEDWKKIGNLARDFELLTEENFHEMLAHFAPNPHSTDYYKEMRMFAVKLLELKIQKNLQEKVLRKQNWVIGATWSLAVTTIIAMMANIVLSSNL